MKNILFCKFILDMMGGDAFYDTDCLLALREEIHYGQKIWDDVNNAKLKELVADLKGTDCCLVLRAKNTDAWMNIQGNTINGAVLAAT